MFFSINFGPDA